MAFEFKLPDVGEGVAEGELVSWLVAPGDTVTEDQPLAEVETDKALVEIPSPVDGTVRELRAEPGEMVPVGDIFIVIDVEGEEPADEPTEEKPAATSDTSEVGAGEAAESEAADRVFAPPHVRRLARELDVELSSVNGSGPGGRITESDVRAAGGTGDGEEPVEVEPETASDTGSSAPQEIDDSETTAVGADTGGAPAGRDRTLAVPATRRVARDLDVDINDVPAVEERDGMAFVTEEAVREYARTGAPAPPGADVATGAAATGDRETRVPYKGLRRTIGDQMEQSKYTAPHVSHHDMADATQLQAAREQLKPRAEERGIRLTYLPFVMKAVVEALSEYPRLNAELDEESEEIIEKHYYNLGVAVATDAGLMVPVVKNVDQKGVFQLASEVNELAAKARDRSIARDEMQDGTFTITNFGAIGGEHATPIINYPEVAILGLGAIDKRPVVQNDDVVPQLTLPISMSIDHRVVDGAEAARFTNRLIEYLESPLLLLK